jgi:glycosyltransferase involved in cell wall biosynthesis
LSLFREREALVRDVESWRPDLVYLRHGLVHPGLIGLARRIPSVVEVNGDDLSEFRLTSRRRYLLARATRGLLLRRAAGLVFVTHELAAMPSFARYRRPGVVIANGIDLASIEPAPAPALEPTAHIVFIGHPDTPWHGLDHVAELAKAVPEWHIDVIGPRSGEVDGAPPNLTAHGPLEPAEYRPLLERADVAVGTLGLYRKRMNEASPLKVREYLAVGVPTIVGYRDSDFLDGADFLLEVPNEATGVTASIERIRDFLEAWRGRRVPRSDVAHLDVRVKERARLSFLESIARG